MDTSYIYLLLLLSTLSLTIFITKKIIPKLSKIAQQPIYEDGPKWHLRKVGTPTMGGIGFIIPIFIVLAVTIAALTRGNNTSSTSLIIAITFSIFNSLIGVTDDITKLKKSQNGGLTPIQKIFFQLIVSILFLASRRYFLRDDTCIYFGTYQIDLGILYYPLAMVFLLGIINCANLTDGIDGLATSVAFSIAVCSFLISFHNNVTVWTMSIAIVGATIGFLLFNIHPAKIFMGDTGSLFLGAIVASMAFSMRSLPAYLLLCIVYVIEGVSVIIQVLYFKKTGKRILKMAPVHHHLEKIGFDENKICIIAMVITFIMSLFALPLIRG